GGKGRGGGGVRDPRRGQAGAGGHPQGGCDARAFSPSRRSGPEKTALGKGWEVPAPKVENIFPQFCSLTEWVGEFAETRRRWAWARVGQGVGRWENPRPGQKPAPGEPRAGRRRGER